MALNGDVYVHSAFPHPSDMNRCELKHLMLSWDLIFYSLHCILSDKLTLLRLHLCKISLFLHCSDYLLDVGNCVRSGYMGRAWLLRLRACTVRQNPLPRLLNAVRWGWNYRGRADHQSPTLHTNIQYRHYSSHVTFAWFMTSRPLSKWNCQQVSPNQIHVMLRYPDKKVSPSVLSAFASLALECMIF